ncbi:helix-turn-helix domain-containing protein [Pantoea vagans]|uniref:winged helix-turn-helix transcriptional regulator n=1 Tax=Pantoea vagans TaxID=470934 RepID=UPI00225AAFF4|nr:helix-turn-helix domain-containing protein [Pantoea vagans]MCX3309052.1 helix-turn-helix domain-containing protein [Pantoea vagans]
MSVSKIGQNKLEHILYGKLGSETPFEASCESRQLLSHITSRWGVLVLICLEAGTQRYSQLRQQLTGVSERMLAKVLKDLEEDGLITRESFPVLPPHTEYTLTAAGFEAAALITQLTDWVGNYVSLKKELSDNQSGTEQIP